MAAARRQNENNEDVYDRPDPASSFARAARRRHHFRDFGGNGVADGRRIKRGLLFRSGSLERLTENDCAFLAGVPVRSVLDYRDADEVQAKPDVLWNGADYHHVPANPLSSEVNANLEKLTNETLAAFDARAFMLELYRRLPFGNAAYQRLAQLLSNPGGGAIVQHCAVGKDRTGVGSALVLFALGPTKRRCWKTIC